MKQNTSPSKCILTCSTMSGRPINAFPCVPKNPSKCYCKWPSPSECCRRCANVTGVLKRKLNSSSWMSGCHHRFQSIFGSMAIMSFLTLDMVHSYVEQYANAFLLTKSSVGHITHTQNLWQHKKMAQAIQEDNATCTFFCFTFFWLA